MPLKILLADDHAVVRQGLRTLLEHSGFEVIGDAGDGQKAIQLAEKFHPDVAVLDVAMPATERSRRCSWDHEGESPHQNHSSDYVHPRRQRT